MIPDGPLLEFPLRGRFPKYALTETTSGTGKATVMTPAFVRVVLARTKRIHVLSTRAFER